MSTRELWLQGKVTAAEERDLYDQGEISECEYEFGPHEDHSDCQRMIHEMSSASDMMSDMLRYEQDTYSREAEEESLGRPLFPNEY